MSGMFNLPARRICEITTTAVLLTCAAVHSPELVLAKTSSCPTCPVAGVVATQTQSLGDGTQAGGTCATRKASNGYPLPDPKCTPGAFNPSVAVAQFGNKKFTTKCVRDCTTSGAQKFVMYKSYGISKNPSCELDHLVPLEMGGADSVDNIWPQCGMRRMARTTKTSRMSLNNTLPFRRSQEWI